MAYKKPGVTVRQVQTSVSPSLFDPTLMPVVAGEGYFIGEKYTPYTTDEHEEEKKYNNAADSTYYLDLPDNVEIDEDSLAVVIKGQGATKLVPQSELSYSSAQLTIVSGYGSSYNDGKIEINFRATISGINTYFTVDGEETRTARIGEARFDNPLGMVASLMQTAAGSVIGVVGTSGDTTHSEAIEKLELQEVYAIAPASQDSTVLTNYQAHVTSMSLPDNKKERILFQSLPVDWYDADGEAVTGPTDTDMNKSVTAQSHADATFGLANKRVFNIFPDAFYMEQTIPVHLMKQSYIDSVFGDTFASQRGLYCKLTSQRIYSDITYYAGDDIDNTLWEKIMDDTSGVTEMKVLIPVPGYYLAAIVAGRACFERPEQPMTNLPLGDYGELLYSNKFFTQAQLDTMAGGGNWVLVQKNPASQFITRHQLSTDMSSIEVKEHSITKTVDFVSKFVRDGVEPYIGKYVITESYIKMLRSILIGQGTFLKREGYLNDFKVEKVEQDQVSKDTILVSISIAVKYPVNYIRITLQF